MTQVINFFGGPGLGKSTSAAGLFASLKRRNVNAELVTEFCKDLVWEERHFTFSNQIYLFGKQHHRFHRLLKKVDYIVTDSPCLLSIAYNEYLPECFNETVLHAFKQFNNINIVLKRNKPYQHVGRIQTESESKEMDNKIKSLLDKSDIPYYHLEIDFQDAYYTDQLAEKILAGEALN